jgi:hypothetical protein
VSESPRGRARYVPSFDAAATLPALASLLLLATACKVDEDAFQSRVFGCDTAAPDPLCGTDKNGDAMTCFAARQLGGADFCVQKCDAPMALPDEQAMCVQGNAKLKTCNPVGDAQAGCGRPELGCLRTDVTSDEGVCVTMQPCTQDGDCHDPVRSTCASTFLTSLYKDNPDLHADHLYCLQERCIAGNAACSPGETCLKTVIPPEANPPDICVPNCSSSLQCPPNFFCYKKLSGPANPAVCIPGLLGFVCETDVDCLVGKCVDDQSAALVGTPDAKGLHLCTVDCGNDDECSKFDSEQGLFVCNKQGHCATPSAYRGASCDSDADCIRNPGTVCTWFSQADQAAGKQGTCIYPCAADGSCPAYGGINHTCVLGPDQVPQVPTCFPGFFTLPCFTDDNCIGDLTCRGADPASQQPGFCTALCAGDDDCAHDRWTTGQSFCGTGLVGGTPVPICLPLLNAGDECASASQCQSHLCTPTTKDGMSVQVCGGM